MEIEYFEIADAETLSSREVQILGLAPASEGKSSHSRQALWTVSAMVLETRSRVVTFWARLAGRRISHKE